MVIVEVSRWRSLYVQRVLVLFIICAAWLCLLSGNAFAAGAWSERTHPSVDYVAWRGAGMLLYEELGGYNAILDADSLFAYRVELAFSPIIPLLSRLQWVSSAEVVLTPELVNDDNESSYNQLFAEFRLPFKTNFLSYQTSWYIQYGHTAMSMASVSSDFSYNGTAFDSENVSIGSQSHYIALAIDTPATDGDSPDSLSRFGIFYQYEERLRGAERETLLAEDELIGTDEHRIGLFYDITKPVFTEGFIMNIHLKLAFAFRNIHANPYGYTRSDFNDASSLLLQDVGISLAYRFKFGDSAGARLFVDYEYNSIMALVAENDFNNSYGQRASAGLMLDYFF